MKNIKNIYQWIQIISIILGLLVSAYLWSEYQGSGSIVCPISDCSAVMNSEYSQMLGVPLPAYGFAFFIAAGFLLFEKLVIKHILIERLYILVVSFGLAFTLILRLIEFLYVHAWCMWCWTTFFCCIALFIATIVESKKEIV